MSDIGRPVGVAAGSVVAGCRLVTEIGAGGSGRVWLGVDRATGARVAVKVFDEPLPPAGRVVLSHAHVVRVLRRQDDPPSVVMELAEGGSLSSLVTARGPLDPDEVVTVLVALAGALADLHRAGVVHGDVTGPNILFAGNGRPLLADVAGIHVAGVGPRLATAGYVAPEVLAGQRPGPAADVHGLCCAAWLALAGTLPGPVPTRVPLPVLAHGAPGDLLDLVSRGVDPDPTRRPAPADLATAAAAACRAAPVRLVGGAMPALPAPEAVTHRLREWSADPAPGSADGAPIGRGRRWRQAAGQTWARRGRTLVGVAAAGVVLGVLVAGSLIATRAFDATAAEVPVVSVAPIMSPAVTTPVTPSDVVDLPAVVAELVQRREAMLRLGDAGALDSVYVVGSPAAAADRALMQREGPLDIDLSVEFVSGTGPGAGSASVDARVTAHVAGADGTGAPEPVRIDLSETPTGWRIAAVAAAGP